MFKSAFRGLRTITALAFLAGNSACDDIGSTAAGTGPSRGSISWRARLSGRIHATLEAAQPGGGFATSTLPPKNFDVAIPAGKAEGDRAAATERLFVRRTGRVRRGTASLDGSFSFSDAEGRLNSVHFQRLSGGGPISRIVHYRDGIVEARSVRNWRPVQGGWIATGTRLEIVRDGKIISRLSTSVHAAELVRNDGDRLPSVARLLLLAGTLAPSELQAQSRIKCQSEAAEYGEAYGSLVVKLVARAVFPVFGPSLGEISQAYERYEQATSELQRCLSEAAI